MSVAISVQPAPSDPVSKFLAKPPRLLIDNKWVESESGKTIPVIDPATGAELPGQLNLGSLQICFALLLFDHFVRQRDWEAIWGRTIFSHRWNSKGVS